MPKSNVLIVFAAILVSSVTPITSTVIGYFNRSCNEPGDCEIIISNSASSLECICEPDNYCNCPDHGSISIRLPCSDSTYDYYTNDKVNYDDIDFTADDQSKKCKCESSFEYYSLKWENGSCFVSPFGPCGTFFNGSVTLVCSHGFVCVNNTCVNPDPSSPHYGHVKSFPFRFQESNCKISNISSTDVLDCVFSQDLSLDCDKESGHCVCKTQDLDHQSDYHYFGIKNYYDGQKNCSVPLLGDCGERKDKGLKIECHGDGVICMNGTCRSEFSLPYSSINESCWKTQHCQIGLICSTAGPGVCIVPNSLQNGQHCMPGSGNECQTGLSCIGDYDKIGICTQDNEKIWTRRPVQHISTPTWFISWSPSPLYERSSQLKPANCSSTVVTPGLDCNCSSAATIVNSIPRIFITFPMMFHLSQNLF